MRLCWYSHYIKQPSNEEVKTGFCWWQQLLALVSNRSISAEGRRKKIRRGLQSVHGARQSSDCGHIATPLPEAGDERQKHTLTLLCVITFLFQADRIFFFNLARGYVKGLLFAVWSTRIECLQKRSLREWGRERERALTLLVFCFFYQFLFWLEPV